MGSDLKRLVIHQFFALKDVRNTDVRRRWTRFEKPKAESGYSWPEPGFTLGSQISRAFSA